jgi:hypothetical protein
MLTWLLAVGFTGRSGSGSPPSVASLSDQLMYGIDLMRVPRHGLTRNAEELLRKASGSIDKSA